MWPYELLWYNAKHDANSDQVITSNNAICFIHPVVDVTL